MFICSIYKIHIYVDSHGSVSLFLYNKITNDFAELHLLYELIVPPAVKTVYHTGITAVVVYPKTLFCRGSRMFIGSRSCSREMQLASRWESWSSIWGEEFKASGSGSLQKVLESSRGHPESGKLSLNELFSSSSSGTENNVTMEWLLLLAMPSTHFWVKLPPLCNYTVIVVGLGQ